MRIKGKSGKSADNRSGFQRLMTEVSLNHVEIVLGLELSRLSRSSKDWHQLIDVCAIFNTLLCDQDGVTIHSTARSPSLGNEGRDERIRACDTPKSLAPRQPEQGGAR